MSSSSRTPTLAARRPDGWWTGHTRYRNYVLFAATGGVLWLVNLLLLWGVWALSRGSEAWSGYMDFLRTVPGLVVSVALAIGTLYFALRWLRVGAKIPGVLLGNLQNHTVPLILGGHFAGFITLTAILVLLLSGAVV